MATIAEGEADPAMVEGFTRLRCASPEAAAPSRRAVLKGGAVASVALGLGATMLTGRASAETFVNAPVGRTVTFGFDVPLTGRAGAEGGDALRGYELAVAHLNDGGGLLQTLQPLGLTGQGVLGREVAFVAADARAEPELARRSALRMIGRDRVVMWSGGAGSAAAIAHQRLAQEAGVLFLSGASHAAETTGAERRRYGFRHFFNAHQTALALAPVLIGTYGADRAAYHLSTDNVWGRSLEAAMRRATEAEGWRTLGTAPVGPGGASLARAMDEARRAGADVLVLNLAGEALVTALGEATALGLRDAQSEGRTIEIVAPLYSDLLAADAEGLFEGVLGTAQFAQALDDPASRAFVEAFVAAYDVPPGQHAHTAYVQTLLYANACELAGTFHPVEVILVLEGQTIDGIGPGTAHYRADDHQCLHDVLVLRGRCASALSGGGDAVEIVRHVPREAVTYRADLAAFGGPAARLGPYEIA